MIGKVMVFLMGVMLILIAAFFVVHGSFDFCVPDWNVVVAYFSNGYSVSELQNVQRQMFEIRTSMERNIIESSTIFARSLVLDNITDFWGFFAAFGQVFSALFNLLGSFFVGMYDAMRLIIRFVYMLVCYIAVPFELMQYMFDASLLSCPINP